MVVRAREVSLYVIDILVYACQINLFILYFLSNQMKVEKEKDPNAPKKPANAFLMFCTTQRSTVQEEYFKVTLSAPCVA